MNIRKTIVTNATNQKKDHPALNAQRAEFSPSTNSPVDQILQLQKTIGNRAVQRLIKSGALQAKLKIGQPHGMYEQQANLVSEAVRKMPAPLVQRQTDQTSVVVPGLESKINSLKGGGQPLPKSVHNYYEPLPWHDFSQVRLHTDSKPAKTAYRLKAQLFAMGQNSVFGARQYAPETATGGELWAHKLAHVRQQNVNIGEALQKADVEEFFPPSTEKPKEAIPEKNQKKAAKEVLKTFTFPAGHTSEKFTGYKKKLVEKGRAMIAPGTELAKKMAAGTMVTYKTVVEGKEKEVTEKKSVVVSDKVMEVPVLVMWELYKNLSEVKEKSEDETTKFLVDVIVEFWLNSGSTAKLGTTWVRDFPELTKWLESRGFDAITSKDLISGPIVFIAQHKLIEPGPYRHIPAEEKAKRTVDLVTAHEIIHALGYTESWIHEFLEKFGLSP